MSQLKLRITLWQKLRHPIKWLKHRRRLNELRDQLEREEGPRLMLVDTEYNYTDFMQILERKYPDGTIENMVLFNVTISDIPPKDYIFWASKDGKTSKPFGILARNCTLENCRFYYVTKHQEQE